MKREELWKSKLKCNHCGRFASGYSIIGWWENAVIAYCKHCDKYIMDIGGSTTSVDGETSHVESYHDITKEQFEKWKDEKIKTTDIKNEIYHTTIYK